MKPFLGISLRLIAPTLTALALASTALAEQGGISRPTVYPVGKRSVHLGGPEKYAEEWTGVEAPQSVVEAAKGILKGQPAKWSVSKLLETPTPGKIVVFLKNEKNDQMVFWVKKDSWIRLNEKGGISTLNEVTKDMPGRRVFSANITNRILYVQEIANLYGGSCRALLSNDFLNEAGGAKSDGGKPWVTGTEKNPEAFYKLCRDPVLTRKGANVSVNFNVLVFGGSAEEWTLTGTYDHGMVLHEIDVKVLRKPDTFRWNCE